MAIVAIFDFPGEPVDKYEKVFEAGGPAVFQQPSRLHHVCYRTDSGFTVADVWTDEQAKENYRLAGGRWHLRTIDDATHILGAKDERVNLRRLWARYWRYARPWVAPAWFALLDLTRPVRRALGMQTKRGSAGQRREIE